MLDAMRRLLCRASRHESEACVPNAQAGDDAADARDSQTRERELIVVAVDNFG
jgi:hypothetical protein